MGPVLWAMPGPRCRTRFTNEERGGDHVNISPERDALTRATAGEPWVGNETSRRNTPQPTVIEALGAVVLLCLGLLLGWSWTLQAFQPTLRRQAEERRKLNEEWSAVRAARRQRSECPHCGSPLVG